MSVLHNENLSQEILRDRDKMRVAIELTPNHNEAFPRNNSR